MEPKSKIMKNTLRNASKILLFLFLVSLTSKNSQCQAQLFKKRGQDIWERTIAYHDPYNKWNSYTGILQEITVFANNHYVQETIEINKPDDYYLSTVFQSFGIIKRGMDKGKYFFSLNGNQDVPAAIKNDFGLSEAGIIGFREQHMGHFGLPMHLKSSGMKVQRKAKVVDFEGRKCFELSFIGTPETVINKYYEGKLILYIDTKFYSMRGLKWEPARKPAYYVVFSKEIEINGVRIPHVMSCYRVENNTPLYSSINNPFKE
jgi:hypothetical protein